MTSRVFGESRGRIGRLALSVLALSLAACSAEDGLTGPAVEPAFSSGSSGGGELVLCKYTEDPTDTKFKFEVSATDGRVPGNGRFTLNATQGLAVGPDCAVIWTATGTGDVTVTIGEDVPLGWELHGVFYSGAGFIEPLVNPVEITVNASTGGVVFFKNRPAPIDMLPGRMTGGGGQFTIDDVHVTRGFTIHCDITLSNNVEINWADHRWHLDKPLTSAICIDDPDVEPAPPPAPFDTFIGEGIGRLNNVDGSFMRFTFVDSGEPGGKNDMATIHVWAPGDDPAVDAPVLSVDGYLDHGNLQAHYDQPHK